MSVQAAQISANFCPSCRQPVEPDAAACGTCSYVRGKRGWPADLLVGKVILDKYRVDRRLGAGGFGVVVLAMQLHGQQELGHVVLKFLHNDLVNDESIMRRFVNEARAARQLASPHAVKVFDLAFGEDGVPFIVMEYLEGESLADTILAHEGWLPVERVLRIGMQVAQTLAECHDKDILHRDLKPDNILLLPGHHRDFVKILDFGIARVPSQVATVSNTFLGTPKYMAPEQLMQQEMDGRVDIFALGVILFECLAGIPPIPADTPMEYIVKNCITEPIEITSLVPDTPPRLAELIGRMLAKSADERPASMYEVLDELTTIHQEVEESGRSGASVSRQVGGQRQALLEYSFREAADPFAPQAAGLADGSHAPIAPSLAAAPSAGTSPHPDPTSSPSTSVDQAGVDAKKESGPLGMIFAGMGLLGFIALIVVMTFLLHKPSPSTGRQAPKGQPPPAAKSPLGMPTGVRMDAATDIAGAMAPASMASASMTGRFGVGDMDMSPAPAPARVMRPSRPMDVPAMSAMAQVVRNPHISPKARETTMRPPPKPRPKRPMPSGDPFKKWD